MSAASGRLRSALVLAAVLLPLHGLAQEIDSDAHAGVIQNRAYSLGFEINAPVLGTLPLDPYYKGYTVGVGLVVHFNDYLAWQAVRGSWSFNATTPLRDQLERDFGQLPTSFDEVSWYVGTDFMLKPFYGKSSVVNSFVVHYEAYFLLGGSVFRFKYAPGVSPALSLGGGVRLFHNKYLSNRLDVTDNLVIDTRALAGGKLALKQVITIQLMLGINFGGGE